MKQKTHLLTALITCALLTWNTSYATDDHDHHAGHDHSAHAADAHDHDTHKDAKSEDDHSGHDHTEAKAGPNGGRIITSVEPHLEFYLTEERRVQITFLNDDGAVIAPEEPVVSLIGGDRQNPTRLRFTPKGSVLISDKALPESNNLPIILSIKPDAKSKTVRERFNLNLSQCSSCSYKEYACICDHD
ncbi:MAG: hypothetical protein ACSHYA_14905 [Opitutaceae bacterium]